MTRQKKVGRFFAMDRNNKSSWLNLEKEGRVDPNKAVDQNRENADARGWSGGRGESKTERFYTSRRSDGILSSRCSSIDDTLRLYVPS